MLNSLTAEPNVIV